MILRDRPVELGLALAIFVVAVLGSVVLTTVAGVLALALGTVLIGIAQRADEWAIVDLSFGVLLVLLGGTTLVTPEWGVPLLVIAGGVQLVRALGDVGMAINLVLLAALAFVRGTPDWAVGILVVVAVGKVAWILREQRRIGSSYESRPT
jgi:hypothetical protein